MKGQILMSELTQICKFDTTTKSANHWGYSRALVLFDFL